MAVIELQIGGAAFTDLIAGFDQLASNLEKAISDVAPVTAPLLMTSLNNVALALAKKHGNPWNGQVYNGSPNLQSRSGAGLTSIFQSIKLLTKNDDLVAAQISAGDLSFHETGGMIRAKSAQYLTIPLPEAMDPRGVPLKARARQWDHTFTARSKKGNLLIFRRLPGARDLTPLYILKPEVYIKPRLGMQDAMDTEFGYFDARLFEKISAVIEQYV